MDIWQFLVLLFVASSCQQHKSQINGKEVNFHALTAIDPFTSWIEIIPVLSKTGPHITNLFEQEWLWQYPRPGWVIYDQGIELQNEDFYKLCAKWNLLLEPITTANSQANSIVERVHQIMGDMIRVQLMLQHEHDNLPKIHVELLTIKVKQSPHAEYANSRHALKRKCFQHSRHHWQAFVPSSSSSSSITILSSNSNIG